MKEAAAAQASNLGQVLAPAIAGHFRALTEQRGVQLRAQLGMDGACAGWSQQARGPALSQGVPANHNRPR